MRKKRLIAIFILMAVLIMPVAVFADVPMPDPPLGAYQYWVCANSFGKIKLYTSPNPIHVEYNNIGNLVLDFYNMKSYDLIDGNWSYGGEWMGGVHSGFETIYASNHNIAYLDGSGFFFTPPKVSTLSQIVRQAKSQGTFGMIWTIILAGLTPLLGCLILGISFRKGWAFLRRQLTH